MSLQAKLDAFKADFEAGKPPYNATRSRIEMMHRAIAELVETGAARRAKKAGDVAPSFSLKGPEGNLVNSVDLLKRGPCRRSTTTRVGPCRCRPATSSDKTA